MVFAPKPPILGASINQLFTNDIGLLYLLFEIPVVGWVSESVTQQNHS